LDLEAPRRLPPSDFDAAGDDARDVRALFDDPVEDLIEPADAAVLALDAAELHRSIIRATLLIIAPTNENRAKEYVTWQTTSP
jgi:hypothetical protein